MSIFDRPKVRALLAALHDGAGTTEPALRKNIFARAAVELGVALEEPAGELPEALRAFVAKTARHAYKVTDEDIAALKAAGYSEDQILEVTSAAAIGASRACAEAAFRALRGERGGRG